MRRLCVLGQFSQQCCEFWSFGIYLIELLHSPEVRGREALQLRGLRQQPVGQLFDYPFALACLSYLAGQVRSNRPVGFDQCNIDGFKSFGAACVDDAKNFRELSVFFMGFIVNGSILRTSHNATDRENDGRLISGILLHDQLMLHLLRPPHQ